MDKYGRVDILINNAGILRDKKLFKSRDQDFRMVVEVLDGALIVQSHVGN